MRMLAHPVILSPFRDDIAGPLLQKLQGAIEVTCYRRLLNISYKGNVAYEEVCSKMQDGMTTSQAPMSW